MLLPLPVAVSLHPFPSISFVGRFKPAFRQGLWKVVPSDSFSFNHLALEVDLCPLVRWWWLRIHTAPRQGNWEVIWCEPGVWYRSCSNNIINFREFYDALMLDPWWFLPRSLFLLESRSVRCWWSGQPQRLFIYSLALHPICVWRGLW